MSSIRLKQGHAPQAKPDALAGDFSMPNDYPSTRYFQVHFQHLHETIDNLKQQIGEANRQIAEQNEILRTVVRQTHVAVGSHSSPLVAKPGNGSKKKPTQSASTPVCLEPKNEGTPHPDAVSREPT